MRDFSKTDTLLRYILALAGEEDWGNQELGPIHLIKYLYLADLAHASQTGGETFTGLPWRFHKFGPWTEDAFLRIDTAMDAAGATKRTFSTLKYEDDIVRYSLVNDRLLAELDNQMPLHIAGQLRKAVHRFGADTESLLDYVYKTPPMLTAAPGEYLNFSGLPEGKGEETVSEEAKAPLTAKQKKKRTQAAEDLKRRFLARVAPKDTTRKAPDEVPPYDDVFLEGLKWLDLLAGDPVSPMKGEGTFSPDIWKSKARYDPDLS
jgi:hypothetical protein